MSSKECKVQAIGCRINNIDVDLQKIPGSDELKGLEDKWLYLYYKSYLHSKVGDYTSAIGYMGILLLLYQNVPDKTGKKMELFQKQMIMLKEKLKESLSVSKRRRNFFNTASRNSKIGWDFIHF